MQTKAIACFIALFLLFAGNMRSQDIWEYSSENMRLFYLEPGIKYIIPHAGRCFENAYNFHKDFWNFKSKDQLTVLFNDFHDNGNGGAMVTPWNFVSISVAPFDFSLDVIPATERMQWLMSHELTHIVVADKPSSGDNFWRGLFGGKLFPDNSQPLSMIYAYLASPRWYSPRWYHEGIAVFMETWLSGGIGRSMGGYDEMVFRTMVRDGAYFYTPVGLETEGTTIDFQVGVNAYLYGTRFVSFLAGEYGLEKLKKFYNRTNDSRRFYASQFENVYGEDIETVWDKWVAKENDFQLKNLNKIKEFPVSAPERVLPHALGSVSKAWFDKDMRMLFAAVNYPGELAHITGINIDTKEITRLGEVTSPSLYSVASLGYDHRTKQLFVSTQNQQFRGLEKISVLTGKTEELIAYSRTGDFAINPADGTLWGIRHWAGRAALVQIAPPYEQPVQIYSIPYGKSFYGLDISDDGKLLMGVMAEASGRQRIAVFQIDSLLSGIHNFDIIYEFEGSNAADFKFSHDGKYIYGSSFYTGVSNIFRVDLQSKQTSILTNAETGYFRPVPISSDSLIVFEYTLNGLQPCFLKIDTLSDVNAIEFLGMDILRKNPELSKIALPSASSINIDSIVTFEGDYNSFENISLASYYPIVEGYKDFPSYGLRLNFMDRTLLTSLNLNLSYSPNIQLPESERYHLLTVFRSWYWTIKFGLNSAEFYDLFGPTKLSRKGHFISMNYDGHLYYSRAPRTFTYSLNASYRGDIDRMPDYQNVAADFDKMASFGGNIYYSYMRKSLGGIESEQGWSWKLTSRNYIVNKEAIAHLLGNLDAGLLLPLRNSSIWLRLSAGNVFSAVQNSFGNFYFGGFGNNYIDYQNQLRYREYYSMPGLKLNEAAGRNFGKALAEINLPPIRFKKLGFLYLYPVYTRFSLFGSALALNLDKRDRNYIYNCGAQADIELAFFTLLKTTFSAGYGVAFRERYKPSGELMLSLKIL